ncbi:MAG: hypothetical protein AAFU79_23530 [Myxococcota bacterium]
MTMSDFTTGEIRGSGVTARSREVGTDAHGAGIERKRRLERRELLVYYYLGFVVFLPLVCGGRALNLLRGRMGENDGSAIAETSARVGDMLGFAFMA